MQLFDLHETQKAVASDIEDNFRRGFLPQSLLFSGPTGSSRLTGALDLSFMLLDDEKNRKLLKASQIVFIPSRNLEAEANAAMALYSKQRTNSSRIFLLQCVRKILFQYHSSLLDAYDKKTSSYFSQAEEIAAFLYDYDEEREYSEKEIKSLISFLKKSLNAAFINKGRKNPIATIDEIRCIQDWFSSGSDEKIAIIENVEKSTEGAKNSLLKMLEEPVEHSHIILISTNAQRLLQTILSRTRKFNFPALTANKVTSFLKSRFNLYDEYQSFEAFFFLEGASDEDKSLLDSALSIFTSLVLGQTKALTRDEKENLFLSIEKVNSYHYFLECVAKNISKAMIAGKIKPYDAQIRMDIINKWVENSDTFNLSQRASLDGIIREVQSVE